MPKEISDNSIEKFLLDADKPVLVEFTTSWCHPCRLLQHVISNLTSLYQGKLIFARYDADKGSAALKKYNVKAYPTIILFKEGESIASKVGGRLDKASIAAFIDSNLM